MAGARSGRGSARTVHKVDVEGRTLELSNLDKVFYPRSGFTKAQVLDYYARVAPAMVPHLRGRPLNLKRYPDGVEAPFFFQKECPANRPEWMETVRMWSETKGDHITFCSARDAPSLIWLANAGNLEFHTLLSRAGEPERPTMMVFDLDPGEGVGLLESAAVSLLVKDHLRSMGLRSFVKVSGGKGVQPYVPLNTPVTFDETRAASLDVAVALERLHPRAVVHNMRKDLRKGKVLIDYSQNSRHKSTVCAYSLRARPEPSVAAPVTWDEVEDAVDARDAGVLRFGPQEVLRRVDRMGDLFAPVLRMRQRLPKERDRVTTRRRPPPKALHPPRAKRAPHGGPAGKAKRRHALAHPWEPRRKAH